MQSIRVPRIFKIFLVFVIMMYATVGSIGASSAYAKEKKYENNPTSIQAARQGNGTLVGNHTYSDIYASVIFSKSSKQGKGSATDETTSYDEMMQYPTANVSTDDPGAKDIERHAVYGHLTSPMGNEPHKQAGVQFTNIAKTLYHYDWLVPAPKSNNNDNAVSTFFKALFGDEQSKSKSVLKMLSDTGSKAASAYDMFYNLIDRFEDLSVSINIPKLFESALGHGDSKGFTNTLNNSLTAALNSMGMTNGAIKTLQYIIYSIIIFLFIVTIIWAMRNKNAKQSSIDVLKRRAIPILVIIMTIPISKMGMNVMDEMSDSFDNATKSSPNDFNSHYVVDTLNWAATTNLNIGLINPSSNVSSSAVDKSMTSFKPTPDRVSHLMTKVNSNAIEAKLGDKDLTAKKLMKDISDQKVIDVNSYLTSISTSGRSQSVAASYVPMFKGEKIKRANNGNAEVDSYQVPDDAKDPMFFFPSQDADQKMMGEKDDTFQKNVNKFKNGVDKDNKGEIDISHDYQYRDSTGQHVSGDGDAKAARKKLEEENGYPVKWLRITDHVMPFSENSKYSYINLKKQDPTGYIYGAGLSGNANDSTTAVENYTDGPDNNQKVDFVTGEKYKQVNNKEDGDNKDDDGDGKEKPSAKKSDFERDAKINSLRIALMNRYAGITSASGSNTKSLSTQSVTFLLQTLNTKKGLQYEGQNAVPTSAGAKKNSGKNGNGFVRYTIPNTGLTDLAGKIGSMNIVWMTSAIVAAITFLYLLRAPIFGSIIKMFKSYLAALFTGSLAGLLTYLTFYAVIRASFMFAKTAVLLGSMIASSIVDGLGQVNKLLSIAKFIPGASGSVIFVSIIFALALCWPITQFTIGGKQKRTSIVGIVVLLPYIVGEALEEWFNTLQERVTGKRSNGKGFVSGRMRGISPKESAQHMGRTGAKIAGGAAMIGTGVGGLTAGAAGGLARKSLTSGNALGKARSFLSGGDGKFASAINGESSSQQGIPSRPKDGMSDNGASRVENSRGLSNYPFTADAARNMQGDLHDDSNLNENATQNQDSQSNEQNNEDTKNRNEQTGQVANDTTKPNNDTVRDRNDAEKEANRQLTGNDNVKEPNQDEDSNNETKDGEDNKFAAVPNNGTKEDNQEEHDPDNIEGRENDVNDEGMKDEKNNKFVAIPNNGTKEENQGERDSDNIDGKENENENENNEDMKDEDDQKVATRGRDTTKDDPDETTDNDGNIEKHAQGDQHVNHNETTHVYGDNHTQNTGETHNHGKASQNDQNVKDMTVDNQDTDQQDTSNQNVKDNKAGKSEMSQAAVVKSGQGVNANRDDQNVKQTANAQKLNVEDVNAKKSNIDETTSGKATTDTNKVKDQDTDNQETNKQNTNDEKVKRNQTDQNAVNKSQQRSSNIKDQGVITQNAHDMKSNNVSAQKDNGHYTPRQERAVQAKKSYEKVIEKNNKYVEKRKDRIKEAKQELQHRQNNPNTVKFDKFDGKSTDDIKNEIRNLNNNIAKAKDNNNKAMNGIQKQERIINNQTKTIKEKATNTINKVKETNTYKQSEKVAKGTGQMAGGLKDLIKGESSSNKPKASNNNNNRASLAQQNRQQAEQRRNEMRQDQQLKEMKRLNQNLANQNNKK